MLSTFPPEVLNPPKQGLKLDPLPFYGHRGRPEVLNPPKQGLKLNGASIGIQHNAPEVLNPPKQGLKPTASITPTANEFA